MPVQTRNGPPSRSGRVRSAAGTPRGKAAIHSLDDLIPDPLNANRGTDRGRTALAHSLQANGAGRSIVIDKHGRIIGGHKTVEQARKMGLPITVVPTTGDVLVAVQRLDLDVLNDPRARALALADNRVAELDLAWDPAVLQQLHAQGVALDTLWTQAEFAKLLGSISTAGSTEEDSVLAPPPTTTVKRGDLFALGRHRLLCGDATSPEDVGRLLGDTRPLLMATDPPYGVDYDPAARHQAYPQQRTAVGRVMNDTRADWGAAFTLFRGQVVYVWHAALFADVVMTALRRADFDIRSQIIWSKSTLVLSKGAFHWKHEPAWYGVRRGRSAHWCGDRSQTTVWEVPNLNPMGGSRSGENTPTGHSTQKPVRLFELPMLNHTTGADAVYDPFVGSGTSLIAGEKLGRTVLALDLDPIYVDVAIQRWERFTGKKAMRVHRDKGASQGRRHRAS